MRATRTSNRIPHSTRTRRRGAGLTIGLAAALLLSACAAQPRLPDPLAQLRDPTASSGRRVVAAEQAWAMVLSGEGDRGATRATMKTLAWSRQAPIDVRLACLDALLSDPDPAGREDAKQMASMLIWREPSVVVIAFICDRAVANNWTDFTPSIVRSFSRVMPLVKDQDRPERAALMALHPDRSLAEVVFGVFLRPEIEGRTYDADWGERTRMDAWDLLQRLDGRGVLRAQLLVGSEATIADARGVPVVRALRAGREALRAVPRTSEELRWLLRLNDAQNAQNLAWWREAARAIRDLPESKRETLELRHAEAIRWAAANRTDLVAMSREELLDELRTRTESRTRFPRREGVASFRGVRSESVEFWADQMSWADALTVLVVDEALQTPEFARAVFGFAEIDREDRTTEYGGVLEWTPQGRWRLALYPPRASDRRGDDVFVASVEMTEASDRALAHFHLHAQRVDMRAFAGPSSGDLQYAARSGRTCVVFTSIDARTMNMDVFTPDGVVIDLGTLTRPEDASPR